MNLSNGELVLRRLFEIDHFVVGDARLPTLSNDS